MSKKSFLLFLFMAIFALLVSACSGAAEQAQEAVQEAAEEVQETAEEVVEEVEEVAEEVVEEAEEVMEEAEEAMEEAMGAPECDGLTPVSLQLQWVTQSQFAGFFAARDKGFYEEFCLDVTILEGAVDIVPQQVVASGQAEFGIAWVPKVLASREEGADLVNIAQIFQRSGTLQVSWADNPVPTIADMAGKKVGTWGFGNEHELFVALRNEELDPDNPDDVEIVQQSFDMLALLNREIDAAQAMIYNEYAQVLEAENPETGELFQPEELVVIDYNDVGTAMLQDHVFVDAAWLAEDGNEQLAAQFLAGTFKGWQYCRDNFEDCVNVVLDNGPTLGEGHMAWQLNEINKLIWPSPAGIGVMDQALWDQTVEVSLNGGVISEAPSDAFRTDIAETALSFLEGEDTTGEGYTPIAVKVVPGGGAMEEGAMEEAMDDGAMAEDSLGTIVVEAGDSIKIASALVIAGPNETLGVDSQRGVEIAITDRGEVAGHTVELQAEDGGCSAEGGQTAAQKIASDDSIVAVVGHNCSSSCTPAAPIYNDAGLTMISPSCTAPSLTGEGTHVESLLRTAHNDNIQGRVMAEFVYNELGLRSAATIHDGSPYAEQLQQVFADVFAELGGTITAQEAINVGDTDMRPVLTSIATGAPDIIYYPIFIAEGGFVTTQAKEISGLEDTILAGADGMISPDFIAAAGEAAEGMYISGPDLAFTGGAYEAFLAAHQDAYGEAPLSAFHAHAYDAANMIFDAIEAVAKTDADGNTVIGRQALRDALYATSGMDGITGNITCNDLGDCADPKIAVNQITGGAYVPVAGGGEGAMEEGAMDGEAMAAPVCDSLTPVSLQLQWVTQSQFAGYFAAVDQGFYEEHCLDVTILEGAVDIVPQQVVASGQAEFGVAWVPKVLASREEGANLVNIGQVFQRSGTLMVSWADSAIPSIGDMAGQRVGTWGFGNEHELFAAMRLEGIDPDNPDDVEIIQQSFDMLALLNRELDSAQAMTYNEYAQVLEAINPETGELYIAEDLVVIDFNDVGTAMLQDHVFVDGDWLADNEELAVQFLAGTFKGWQFCRDNVEACVGIVLSNGPTLGESHMTWQMNEINKLIWPSPNGLGVMDQALWDQTVEVSLDGGVISEAPSDAFRTDLAEEALKFLSGDTVGADFTPITVELREGGE